jgi:hypothetical protein
MTPIVEQMVIVEYLGKKLGIEMPWYTTPQEFLFNCTPREVILRGDGKELIEWLESRLGLRPGAAF